MENSESLATLLNILKTENFTLSKLLHRNKNQHGKSKLHRQLKMIFIKILKIVTQSDSIETINTQVQYSVRHLHKASSSTVHSAIQCYIGVNQIVTMSVECVLDCSSAVRDIQQQISQLLFLPLFSVYFALLSRLFHACVSIAVHHFKALEVLLSSLKGCAAVSARHGDAINKTLASYQLDDRTVSVVRALIDPLDCTPTDKSNVDPDSTIVESSEISELESHSVITPTMEDTEEDCGEDLGQSSTSPYASNLALKRTLKSADTTPHLQQLFNPSRLKAAAKTPVGKQPVLSTGSKSTTLLSSTPTRDRFEERVSSLNKKRKKGSAIEGRVVTPKLKSSSEKKVKKSRVY
mmetsp:Transcript_4969/g.7589  ORF Transcript_4969/g.7589 Transcript_4969/m.7589 type:complete len:350 (+) Transcript_4969:37-1086(+)